MHVEGKPGLKAIALAKTSHFLIIFVYLWLLLSVYALHNSIVLSDWRLLGHLAPAVLKALIFTKFILIGEHLRLGKRFEHTPLVWLILIKSALFSILLIGFDFLEALLVHAYWPEAASSGPAASVEPTDVRTILAFSFMAFVALIPFFGMTELSKVIGPERMRELFFSGRSR